MSWHFLILFTILLVTMRYIRKRKRIPLPPGPPGDPIIGHLRSIPQVGQDLYFYELGLKYGDIMYFNVLGQPLVILSSVKAATELLDKRSANYSDRPYFPIADLWGITDTLSFLRYGEEFRIQRKIVQQHFTKNRVKDFRPIKLREARIFAQNLLVKPEDRLHHIISFTTAIIMDIVYGYRVASSDDPFVKLAHKCGSSVAESGTPGSTIIDLFPILRHFPSWFPGTSYAAVARSYTPFWSKFRRYPFDHVVTQMKEGIATPSFLSTHLDVLQSEGLNDEVNLKRAEAAAAIMYIGGAETTSSALSFFFLAMLLYPECQVKAQEEMDAVVGSGRLPEFQDRDSLPYLECLVQETLRWHNVAPTGLPHRALEEDIYNGMLIPKGTTVIANIRAMTLDESVYKNASTFDPTRFLPSPTGRSEPYSTTFGFGRRICPGRHMADDVLWIALATALSTTLITKAVGKDGEEIFLDPVPVVTGITNHPKPFPCQLVPRSEAALSLLRQATEFE